MAPAKLSIHVPPDSNPSNTLELITELSRNPEERFESSSDLLDYLVGLGIGTRTELIATASSMGILSKTDEGIKLSTDGLALVNVRDDARTDLLHLLMYSGWSPHHPTEFLQSWAYRFVCDQYWEMGTIDLTSDYLDRQVSEVINVAQTTFAEMNIGEFQEVSFSRKSLRGIHNWLEATIPPAITERRFTRRSFCSPELLIMSIGYVLTGEDNTTGIDILLTPEKREAISRICLLEPNSFDRALDWALPIFSHLIMPGTTAGFYGRFVRLTKLPQLKDIVR